MREQGREKNMGRDIFKAIFKKNGFLKSMWKTTIIEAF